MNYKGKLYGKGANIYFDTGKTSDDWDKLVEQNKILKSAMGSEFNAFQKCTDLQLELNKLKVNL